MENKASAMRDAEGLVRRVLSRNSEQKIDDNIIRIVAEKVMKAIPPYPEKKKT